MRLRDSALLPPYEHPFAQTAHDGAYYEAARTDLKRFARAAFYLLHRDFDFATRVQALLTRYQRDYFAARLGAERWRAIPKWQQAAMLAMIRDLYTPGVGRFAYNLYALPELNCTPLEFVAAEALADADALRGELKSVWRPREFQHLWGGATYRLRVFAEVWSIVYGSPMNGLQPTSTADESRSVVGLLR